MQINVSVAVHVLELVLQKQFQKSKIYLWKLLKASIFSGNSENNFEKNRRWSNLKPVFSFYGDFI
jgi:hypothetical protein